MHESRPYFSILIPCFKRPEYAREALYSILTQTCANYEVVISNNGAEGAVRDSISDLATDSRVRYVESTEVLSMPDHWEYLRSLARGKYVLVLTDRSVLKCDALKIIQKMHDAMPNVSEVISWGWDLYYNDEKILMSYKGDGQTAIINSQEYLLSAASYRDSGYPYALPRGLNSCISMEILNAISEHCGSAFGRLNPDFSVGYRCLHTVKNYTYLDTSLMVSQGLKLSNGGNSAKGDGSDYIKSVGLTMEKALNKIPVKLPFVAVAVPQDLLASFDIYENKDGQREFNWVGFYVSCINELYLKKATGTLTTQILNAFEYDIRSALAKESLDLQRRVKEACDFQGSLWFRFIFLVKRIARKYLPIVAHRYIMQMRGGVRLESALLAKN